MRKTVLALVTGVLVAAGLHPAAAATTPSQVGLVSFVAASYSRSHDTAGFTLDWPNTAHAASYQVFRSRSYAMTNARTYTTRSSTITVTGLAPGRDYFFQVRGVNGSATGKKSARVGHTTTIDPGPTGTMLAVRVMTYNVCSDVCDVTRTTRYPWVQSDPSDPAPRQPAAMERIASASPDILATQEAGKMATPPGYTQARYFSAKRLFYKTSRFDLAPAPRPAPPLPAKDVNGCRGTSALDMPSGHIFLGRHAAGCRYAVWGKLVDRATGRNVLAVDVHAVSGASDDVNADRAVEVRTLLDAVTTINTTDMPVVFAGDFNSHKSRVPDVVTPIMHQFGYRNSFDLARTLNRQHHNSYNGFATSPRIGVKWGDHIDHVWVDPTRSRVDAWRNIVLIRDGRLVKPIPSDHSPIIVDVAVR
ncbi:MAG: hypothetical protein JWP31_2336 [Aeromicrobium sp.]|nr:hypothetical protein [Aeromicrobium sp.]